MSISSMKPKDLMIEPKVSIILMTYNQEQFIRKAIKSALSQTYKNFELIISNNGSTDRTASIIESFLPDKRIIFLNYDSNEGPNIRANQALDIAKGSFISWLYGDDYYIHTKIQDQMNAFSKLDSSYGVVYGPGYEENFSNGQLSLSKSISKSGQCFESFLLGWLNPGSVNPISPLVRSECYKVCRPDNSIFTEGECLYIHLAVSFKFFFLNKPLVVMSEHESRLGKAFKRNLDTHEKSMIRLLDENNLSPRDRKKVYRHISERKINCSWHCFRTNQETSWAIKNLYSAYSDSKTHSIINKHFLISLFCLQLPITFQRLINRILPRV